MLKKTLAVAALLLVTTIGVAQAQDYPPTNSIVADKTTATQGTPVTVSAKTYQVGAIVTFELLSDPVVVGTDAADANGVAVLTFNIPAGTTNGVHTIRATGTGPNGQALVQSTNITVGSTTATVPRTGTSSSKPIAEAGVAALAVGGLLVLVANRRRSKHAAAAA